MKTRILTPSAFNAANRTPSAVLAWFRAANQANTSPPTIPIPPPRTADTTACAPATIPPRTAMAAVATTCQMSTLRMGLLKTPSITRALPQNKASDFNGTVALASNRAQHGPASEQQGCALSASTSVARAQLCEQGIELIERGVIDVQSTCAGGAPRLNRDAGAEEIRQLFFQIHQITIARSRSWFRGERSAHQLFGLTHRILPSRDEVAQLDLLRRRQRQQGTPVTHVELTR